MKLNYLKANEWHESMMGANPYAFDLKSAKKGFFDKLTSLNKKKSFISKFVPCLMNDKSTKIKLLTEMGNIYYSVLIEMEKKILSSGRFTESDALEYNFWATCLNYLRFPLFEKKSKFTPVISNKIHAIISKEIFICSVALSLKKKIKSGHSLTKKNMLFCIDNSPLASTSRFLLKSLNILKNIPIEDIDKFSKIWARCFYLENNFASEKKFMPIALKKQTLIQLQTAKESIFDLFLTAKSRDGFKDSFYGK
jgi:hypothetical protein